MPRNVMLVITAVVLAGFCQSLSSASIVYRTATIDLLSMSLPSSGLNAIVPVTPFAVDAGDTLVFHLDFAGGSLKVKDDIANAFDVISLDFQSNPVGQTGFLFNGFWHFESNGGSLLVNDFSLGYGGPLGGGTTSVNLTDTSFTISGLTYTITVMYKENGRPPFSADAVEFYVGTGGSPVDAVSLSTVPEPHDIWLFLGAAACLFRQRPLFRASGN